ncbi:MAG: hypothetical protein M1598_10375 [Actinobacteria bacterium]|nr:hypothetical protein [Actinomycetota bacterium]
MKYLKALVTLALTMGLIGTGSTELWSTLIAIVVTLALMLTLTSTTLTLGR